MITIISFVCALLLSYSGLYVGILLGINSPEELTPGKKYFQHAKKFFFILFLLSVVYLLRNQWPSLTLLAATYLFFRIFHKRWVLSLQELYNVSGVIVLMVSRTESAVFLLASIVFLYGLPSGALIVQPHTKHKTLLLKRRQFFIKAFNMTVDFISTVALMSLLFVFGAI